MCDFHITSSKENYLHSTSSLFPPSHRLIHGHDDQQDRRNLSPQIMQMSRAVSLPHGPGRGLLPELLVCPIQVFTELLAPDVTGKHRSQLQRDSLLHSVLQPSTSESMSLINLCNTYMFQNSKYAKMYITKDFLDGTEDKKPPANAGDTDQSLVQENSTCCGATKPTRHDCGARSRARELLFLKPVRPEPMLCKKPPQWEARAPQLERSPTHHSWRKPATATKTQHSHKIKNNFKNPYYENSPLILSLPGQIPRYLQSLGNTVTGFLWIFQ